MNSPTTVPVSVYMLTFNNARTVERALRSLAWADEIVVVDSHSTDATREIAGRHTSRIIERDWPGFRDQYQFAADQCRNDWALFVDADEEFPPALVDEMRAELAANQERPETERVFGYECHRRTWYLGRWIMHGGWVPDHEIRLYDRRRGSWQGGLHAKIHINGKTAFFRNFCRHYTYADIADQLRTIDRYSATAAKDMLEAGKRFSWLHLLGNPLWRFCRDYFLKRGFLDGFPGLVVAVNTAFYVFIKHARLWELQRRPPAAEDGGTDTGTAKE